MQSLIRYACAALALALSFVPSHVLAAPQGKPTILRIASLLAATQRPISDAAFAQRSGPPAWKHVPSWSIYGSEDRAIAPPLMAYMAQRAGSKRTVVVPGGSHAVLASRADDVVALIEEAAAD